MGLFTNFKRNHRRNKAWNEARSYRQAGNFAEAAKVWERLAPEALEYNELIYADDCRDAFKLYLQARDPESALRNARNALRVISDSGWITKSDHTVDDICAMVGELYGGGYAPAAEIFANEINAELVKHNLAPRFETKHGKFYTVTERWLQNLIRGYERALDSALHHRIYVIVAAVLVAEAKPQAMRVWTLVPLLNPGTIWA